MRVILAGVPGAGKTTVLARVKERTNIKILNFGDIMLKYAGKYVKNRDEIRKLDTKTIKELQKKAALEIRRLKEKNLIIDTHFVIKTPNGFFPGLNIGMLKIIKPNLLILITAKPEHIWIRRNVDFTRKRDIEGLEDIEEHEKISISYLVSYSAMSYTPFIIVRNDNDMLEKAVDKIVSVLKKEKNNKEIKK
jgi:adenylate kinase